VGAGYQNRTTVRFLTNAKRGKNMTLKKAIRLIKLGNAEAAENLSSYLRFKKGMNYQEIFNFVSKRTDISLAEWDALLEGTDLNLTD
jgi:hypothetical protein